MKTKTVLLPFCLLAIHCSDPNASMAPEATLDSGSTQDSGSIQDSSSEVESIFEGSITIRNQVDVDQLSSYTSVTGDVIVEAPGLLTLSLPILTRIEGSLRFVNNADLQEASFPQLESIGGSLNITGYQAGPKNMLLPQLHSLHDIALGDPDLFHGEVGLQALDLPLLAGSVGSIRFSCNWVGALKLPLVTSAEDVEVLHLSAAPTSIDLSQLASARYLNFEPSPSISLPVLATANGLTVRGPSGNVNLPLLTQTDVFVVEGGKMGLTTISAPQLTAVTGWGIKISNNVGLSSLNLPALIDSSPSHFIVTDNPQLSTCEAEVLLDQLQSLPCDYHTTDNKSDDCEASDHFSC